jgi:hypothetical protein
MASRTSLLLLNVGAKQHAFIALSTTAMSAGFDVSVTGRN